jgi:diacylglycerol kinase family enzyme
VRAVLLFNPVSTTADEHTRDVITAALASELDLEVHPTKQRGHATHVAAGAVHEDVDIVFAYGGDGTAYEVIQALAGTSTRLAVIPGGSTNVLVRQLGLPNEPVEATATLLERIRSGSSVRVGLGRANGRYFASSCGYGFDAAVVRLVERRYRLKRMVRQLSFVWCALQEFFINYDRSVLPITIETPDSAPRSGYGLVVAGNNTPYTYLASRPLQVTPDAAFHRGLDVFGLRSLRTATVLRAVLQVLTTAGHVRSRNADYLRDLPQLTLRSSIPLPMQLDGDYAGEWREVRLEVVPDALEIVA